MARLTAHVNWWAINRPRLWPCDPEDGSIVVVLDHGNGNSDPVWSIEVRLSGWLARPFIAWAGWRWDRDVRRQNARKAA